MPTFSVILPKGSRLDTLTKILEKNYEGISVNVSRDDPPESRSDRLSVAMSDVDNARSEVESLRDELQEWLDNLPENLQSGLKADELQEAIDGLEEVINNLDDASSNSESITFPSMY